jgi:transposase
MKSNLDLNRLRIHDDSRLNGKLLIAFIALIINSSIHKVMETNDLYKKFTHDSLIHELEKITLTTINDKQTISPISKTNKIILEAFGVKVS